MLSNCSIKTLLQQASSQLESISDSAFLDAELLLAHCIDKDRTYLHTWPEKELNDKQLGCFNSLIEKRLTDYPIAYLIGKKAFWTLDLIVTPDVLIPRPETELLVEIALEKIQDIQNPMVLDLGTGSGAIALAIAAERSDAVIVATDNSEKALKVARKNASELSLTKNISFSKSYWFSNLQLDVESFDVILSNPPYINSSDCHLKDNIRYEPQQALVADKEGMSDLEIIIEKSHPFLKKGGWIILEHGFDQAEKTLKLLSANNYSSSKSYRDLNKNWRVCLGAKI